MIGDADHICLQPLVVIRWCKPLCISSQTEVLMKPLLNSGFVVVACSACSSPHFAKSHSPSDDRSATGFGVGEKIYGRCWRQQCFRSRGSRICRWCFRRRRNIRAREAIAVSSGHGLAAAASPRLHGTVPAVEGGPTAFRPTVGSRNEAWRACDQLRGRAQRPRSSARLEMRLPPSSTPCRRPPAHGERHDASRFFPDNEAALAHGQK